MIRLKHEKKKIICLIGPSGSGKTTLANAFVERYGGSVIISHTTRPIRDGEIDGVDYYFIDDTTYRNLHLVEAIEYNKAKYGLASSEIEEKLSRDGETLVAVTFEGYQHLIEQYPAIAVYLDVDYHTQLSRLKNRGDSDSKIEERMNLRDEDSLSKQRVLQDGGFFIDANNPIKQMVEDLKEKLTQAK